MLQEIIKTIQSQSIKPNKIQMTEVTLAYLKYDSSLLHNGLLYVGYPKSNDECFKNGKEIPTVTYICGIPIEVKETAIVPIYVY